MSQTGILLLKLLLTPALIGGVSLAGRRWGPAVSGWLVGLPLTSAPVALYIALEQGSAFAAATAQGILAGAISIAVLCLAYAWLAVIMSWLPALGMSWLAFAAATWALQRIAIPVVPLFAGVVALLVVFLALMPRGVAKAARSIPPRWDLPARILIATAFVLLLTESAPFLGPHLSGLLAPFPIYTTILCVFAHRFEGPAAAARLLRGALLGTFAFAAFFLVVALLLAPVGIAPAFAAATLAAFATQGASLLLVRSRPTALPDAPGFTPPNL